MAYFTENLFERMMVARPDASDRPRKRGRREMLKEYEADKQTGMDISAIANLIYDYTSGYPVLVSHICKLNDEKLDASIRWTREGVVQAVGQIVKMKHPLFE